MLDLRPLTPSPEDVESFEANGFVFARGLFTMGEVALYKDHYMALRAAGDYPGDFVGVDPTSSDPLRRFPRMIHMHRWDQISLDWMTDPRLNQWLTALSGVEPLAVQTMLYFKPPGARGQALHQDQLYLKAQPGTCLAAWLALDYCDEENGCLILVPGSHRLPVLCAVAADTSASFTDITVPVPEQFDRVPAVMTPGDVLFFHGNLIHGSEPNRSEDRFRRSLIGHYLTGDAERVGAFYAPVYRMDQTIVELGVSPGGGPCGVWVDKDGQPVVEMRDPNAAMPDDLHE